jgi:hypothetical protein
VGVGVVQLGFVDVDGGVQMALRGLKIAQVVVTQAEGEVGFQLHAGIALLDGQGHQPPCEDHALMLVALDQVVGPHAPQHPEQLRRRSHSARDLLGTLVGLHDVRRGPAVANRQRHPKGGQRGQLQHVPLGALGQLFKRGQPGPQVRFGLDGGRGRHGPAASLQPQRRGPHVIARPRPVLGQTLVMAGVPVKAHQRLGHSTVVLLAHALEQ